jgi:hypothetical protein
MALDEHDQRSRRCPRLGHQVRFRYCRTQEGAALCPRVLNCWWETFEVEAFLADHLPQQEMDRLRRPPSRPKIESLLEVLEQARKRTSESADDS